jgi:hypothetical protein
MTTQQRSSKAIHITLWIVQIVLAAGFIFGGVMKLFQPIEKLSAMWSWSGQVSVALVKLTGVLDLLGAIGLILPSLFRIKPKLTPIAAIAILGLMICASVFHIVRGETSEIGVNIFFAILAAFVAWGRLKKAPLSAGIAQRP